MRERASIRGRLEIGGAGSFTNNGTVTANITGTLKINVGGTLSDSSGDRWKLVVTAANARLLFASTIGTVSTLSGNFVVPNGTLEIAKAMTTNGRLEQSGGTVEVKENFTMDNDDTGSSADIDGGSIVVSAGKQFIHK